MARQLILKKNITGKKHYLYYHVRKDTNKVFYVGVGTINKTTKYKRATNCAARNLYWKRVFKKAISIKIVVLEDNDDYTKILESEKHHILKLKSKGVILCNLTEGGEGVVGYKHPQRVIDAMKGNTRSRGSKRTPEQVAHWKSVNSGVNHSAYGRTGWKCPFATRVGVYSVDNVLLKSFGSIKDTALYYETSLQNISHKIKFSKLYKGVYFKKLELNGN